MSKDKIKIFLTDEHAVMREGLKELFRKTGKYEFCGESDNGHETIKIIDKKKCDLLLLDPTLSDIPGVELVHRIKKNNPNIKIIILTRLDNDAHLQDLLKSGIDGFLVKNNTFADILRAIRSAQKDDIFISPEVTKKLVMGHKFKSENETDSLFNILTHRENEILKLLAEGHSNADIGQRLGISALTAKKHRINIMKKLDIHNLAGLTRFAMKAGIL
ncbi:MAG: response regulator transcription factor [Spirochaetia bacterium]|nr:response regulator transcription factor [Spirochaetia bacterium]